MARRRHRRVYAMHLNRAEFLERASAVLGRRSKSSPDLARSATDPFTALRMHGLNAGHRIMITDTGGGSAEMIVSEGKPLSSKPIPSPSARCDSPSSS